MNKFFSLRKRGDLQGGIHFKSIFLKHPFLYALGFFLFTLIFLGGCFYLYIAYFLSLPDFFTNNTHLSTSKIFDRNGELLYEIFQPELGKNTQLQFSEIPVNFINATLAAEDINFYSHPGVDLSAIARAIFFNLREGRIVSGASTIPQQLVHNLLISQDASSNERTYGNKIKEALFSIRLSHLYSKEKILELYLNRIYYGNLSYGSGAAAMDYFGKDLGRLDLAESSFLAGIPQSPSAYNPYLYFEIAKKRQQYVLRQMAKYHFINETEALAAAQEPLHLKHKKVEMKAPHFVHYILSQLDEQLGSQLITQGGFSIYTTLDYGLQKQAEDIVSRQIKSLADKHVTNGALLSIAPNSGQILAWVGSENYFDEAIDGSVDIIMALRQPGSSIKPFNYLLALEKGYTPATILDDIPTQFSTDSGPYSPKNYDLKFHGPVRLRNALASSFNIPAVKTLDFVGIGSFISFLKSLGIETLDKNFDFYGLALTLGGGEVRMFDMVRGFNVIANYGNKKDLSSILKITDSNGKNIYEFQPSATENILGPNGKEHAYQIIDILKDPLARLGGFGEGSVLELSHEAAVKTGTTRNFRDNWTIGFTPQILTAVWVGNADATPMQNISGIDGAGPIWHDFMEQALHFLPKVSFQRPSRLKEFEICALSGKKPTDLCPNKVWEWFIPGTEPQQKDDYYRQFWVHKNSGHIIQESCVKNYSKDLLEQKTLAVYPPKFQKWALENHLQLPVIEPCASSSDYSGDYPGDNTIVSSQEFNNLTVKSVIIDTPNQNDEYLIDQSLALKDQKIPMRVTVPLDTSEVDFFIDGEKISTLKEAPFSFLWLANKGRHKVKVEARMLSGKTVESGEVTFVVE